MAKRGRKKKFKVSLNVNPGTLRSIMAVGLLLFSVLALISFAVPDYFINAKLQLALKKAFGYSAVVLPFITAILGLLFIDAFKNKIKDVRILFGLVVLMVTIAGFFHLFISSEEAKQVALNGKGGGFIGFMVATTLKNMISVYGAVSVLLALGVIAIILILNISIDDGIEFFNNYIKTGDIFRLKKRPKDEIEMQEGMSGIDEDEESTKQPEIPFAEKGGEQVTGVEPKFEIIPTISEPEVSLENVLVGEGSGLQTIVGGANPPPDRLWIRPGTDLLDDSTSGPPDSGDVEVRKGIIIDRLSSFGIPAKVVEVQVGPSVSQYAIETPPGIRINRVANLQDDLALALASPTGSVRVEAPIPGKALIGIEVPNNTRAIVDFKSIITSEQMKNMKSKLAIALGKDVGGVTLAYDISKMPHLLIAGATGSGKSVFIHNLIFSIVYRATPQEVKLILIDFKSGVELSFYEDIPHLYAPIVKDVEKAPAVLKWAETEMKRRFNLFASSKTVHIEDYNIKSGFHALPYIVIIVDEFADIMTLDPTSVERSIIRLARLARATGIHLVLAVQRPSTDVITGSIKANIPCRIAFNVIDQMNSRIIIDMKGAEKLLGQGDMLFIPPDKSTPIRLQGSFISKLEKERVTHFLKNQGVLPEYREDIFSTPVDDGKGKSIAAGGEMKDLKYDEAAQVVISAGKGSASLLQRRLSVGYARAARIIDELEKNGIVGPSQGSRAREVLTDALPADEGFEEHEEGVVEEDQEDF